jgi:hypothetical protein
MIVVLWLALVLGNHIAVHQTPTNSPSCREVVGGIDTGM